MKAMYRTLVVAIAAGIVSACAHVPRSPHSSADVSAIRSQYLADYPSGRFNEQIMRGEIAKGMNVLEVLAAWGVPDERHTLHKPNEEAWMYLERDQHSHDSIIYEIVFADRTLMRWYMTRNTTGSGGVLGSAGSGHAAFREPRLYQPESAHSTSPGKKK